MPRIKIPRDEVRRNDLPNLCMVCGVKPGASLTKTTIVYNSFPFSILGIIGEMISPYRENLSVITCTDCTNGYKYEATMSKIFAVGYTLACASLAYPLTTLKPKDILVPVVTYAIVIILHSFYYWVKGKRYAIRCVAMDKTSVSFDLPVGAWGVAYTKYKKDKADLRFNGIPSPSLAARAGDSSDADLRPTGEGIPLEGDNLIAIPKDLPGFLAATAQGDTERVEAMLDKGEDLNTSLPNGMNALHIASVLGEMQMADLLIRRGLNVNSEMGNGLTPMHLAVQSNNQSIVGLLLAKKADPNHKNQEGRSPLHWCAAVRDQRLDSNNRYKMAQLLFKGGGDVTAEDKDGKTAAQLAEESGDIKVAQLLG